MKQLLEEVPLLGGIVRLLHSALRRAAGHKFPGTHSYWEERYSAGGSSGPGSFGRSALLKAKVLNSFVASRKVASVIEFGCGDGRQLQLAEYPEYLGFDISPTAVTRCREVFRGDHGKTFRLLEEYRGERGDLALSIDIIFHLVEDETFEDHMEKLFASAERYVVIYSSNTDCNVGYAGTHVRRRRFTDWVETQAGDFSLLRKVPGRRWLPRLLRSGHGRDFFIYERK